MTTYSVDPSSSARAAEDADYLDRAGPVTRVEPTLEGGLSITFQRMTLEVAPNYVASWRGRPPL